MTYLECIHLLRAMLPNLMGLLFMMGLLGAGVIAVRTSPREQPVDRHFVLFLSVCGVGAVFLVGLLIRLVPNVKPVGDLITAEPVVLILAGAWALGLAVLLLRLTYGWVVLQGMWLFAPRVREGDPLWPVLRACARHVGLRRLPRVAFSRRCRSPLAFGVGNPCVLLPASLRDRPEHELRDVVTHEFAHVCRRDCGAQLLVQIVGSLLWWNPLYWMAAADLRLLREMVCDQIVVSGSARPDRYAALLVRFAERALLPFGPAFAAVRMAERGSLHARIDWLLSEHTGYRARIPRILPTSMTSGETLAFLVFAVVLLACFDAMSISFLEEMLNGSALAY